MPVVNTAKRFVYQVEKLIFRILAVFFVYKQFGYPSHGEEN